MRVNIYSQELTDEVEVVEKTSENGVVYSGVRLMLLSSDHLHHTALDDDRSAVTIWLPNSKDRREKIAATLEVMAHAVRRARQENGAG